MIEYINEQVITKDRIYDYIKLTKRSYLTLMLDSMPGSLLLPSGKYIKNTVPKRSTGRLVAKVTDYISEKEIDRLIAHSNCLAINAMDVVLERPLSYPQYACVTDLYRILFIMSEHRFNSRWKYVTSE